jgi:hypothetical protein
MDIIRRTDMSDKGYRIIRLVNGEKIIAKVKGSTKQKLFLHRPMTIRGMTTKDSLKGDAREWLILNDWLEHCSDDQVGIRLDAILTISNPDEFIVEAYDCQKEYLDTGNVIDEIMDDLPDGVDENMSISELLNEMEGSDGPNSLKDWVENFVSGIIGNAAKNAEEAWNEDDVDKDSPDWGNDLNDWSPYPEDYFGS